MSKEHVYCPEHQIELYYGYQTGECYQVYHSFEATDPTETTDDDTMAGQLADLLDPTPDDEDFYFGSMHIQLPETLVDRIKAEGVQEYLDTLKNK